MNINKLAPLETAKCIILMFYSAQRINIGTQVQLMIYGGVLNFTTTIRSRRLKAGDHLNLFITKLAKISPMPLFAKNI